MKILLLAPQPFFEIRGTPLAVRNLVRVLCGRGHKVDMVTYHLGREVTLENLRVIRTPQVPFIKTIGIGMSARKMFLDMLLAFTALHQALECDYDCFHGVEEAAVIAAGLGTVMKKAVVYDMDSLLSEQIAATRGYAFMEPVVRLMERWTVRHSNLVLTISRRLAEETRHMNPSTQVAVVEDIPLDEDADPVLKKVFAEAVPEGIRYITYAGSLEPYQGIERLIESMPLLLQRVPDAHCLIIGGRPEQISLLQLKVADMGLNGRVTLLGMVEPGAVKDYLERSDILVSPRQTGDNTPYKLYTYMAAGKPVVATDIGAHTAVLDEKSAFICRCEPQSLADAMTRALTDTEEAKQRAAEAVRLVRESYSPESFERKLLDAYGGLGL